MIEWRFETVLNLYISYNYLLYHWSLGNQTKCADLLLLITKRSTTRWAYTDSSTLTYSITKHKTGGGYFSPQGDKPCFSWFVSFLLFLTKSLISASVLPVCRSRQYIIFKSSDSDRSVSGTCWNQFGHLSHFLVRGKPEEMDSFVWPFVDLLRPRLLLFVSFSSSLMRMKVVWISHQVLGAFVTSGSTYN